jgi:hypothetical protein
LLKLWAAGLLAAMLSAGCAAPAAHDGPGSERTAFPTGTGFFSRMHEKTDEIVDIGLPPLPNRTGQPVRLKSITFINVPAVVRIVNVRAYNYRQTHETVSGNVGDLARECPRQFRPHPLSSFVIPPHRSTLWFPVIAFTISRPGRYSLSRVKVIYTSGGHTYWQHIFINYTIVITNPPRPGPTPAPPKEVCG